MKPKCLPLLFFLGFYRTSAAVSPINESEVKNYVVERRTGGFYDLFTIKMKDGLTCTIGHQVSSWCGLLFASFNDLSWKNGSSCSCDCGFPHPLFVPSMQTCVSKNKGARFGGCKDSLDGEALLENAITLGVNGSTKSVSATGYDKCYLHVQYFDYSGFEERWKKMTDSIFYLKLQGEERNRQFSIKWNADTNEILSGRIIRLDITCNKSSSAQPSTTTYCRLFKALGTVTYYSSTSASSAMQISIPTVPTSMDSHTPMPSVTYPPPSPLSLLSPPPSPLPFPTLSSSSLSLNVFSSTSTKTLGLASTEMLSVYPSMTSQTGSIIETRPTSLTSGQILLTSKTERQSSLPFHSEESSVQVVSTGIPNTVKPSKSSLATKGASSTAAIGPGNKEARTNGNDDGVVIGAAVGGVVVFGIFVIAIIVFCRRRKLWKNTEKASGLEVKNPVYGSSDIPLDTTTENQVKTSSEQDSQPTYQDLITNNGQINEPASHSSRDDNYDNYTVYQSLDKKKPGAPVYESLKKGQVATGKPNLSTTGRPRERPNVSAEPVYNVLEQPDAEQGAMPERVYGDPGHGNHGDTQDPLYNVLEGPDAEETYTAPDVGDPLYNVLEGPESRQGPQEPLYNVLESSDAENSSSKTQGPYDGANSEPLYNVLEEPDSDGPNKDGVGVPAPNGSTFPEAHDNPAYEQTLELNAPYTSVHKPGSQRESVYEPLRGPERQDLYMPISKGRTAHT